FACRDSSTKSSCALQSNWPSSPTLDERTSNPLIFQDYGACYVNGRFIYSGANSGGPPGFTESLMRPTLSPDYRPSEDEEFMNAMQLEYFRQKLLRWRAELLAESTETLQHLKEESLLKPDLTDRASLETERAIELRTRDR